jgi:hypothetical protein
MVHDRVEDVVAGWFIALLHRVVAAVSVLRALMMVVMLKRAVGHEFPNQDDTARLQTFDH